MMAALVTAMAGCGRGSYRHDEGMIWNTTYHITYRNGSDLSDSVASVLREVGKSLNVFDHESLVSRVNAGVDESVDTHFERVYLESVRVHEASGGYFDPTLSPLIKAWGFGEGHVLTADTAAVDSILDFVGLKRTSLAGSVLHKEDRRTSFNFSAVAKGYGCDAVAAMLRRNGVKDWLVEIGGEISLGGVSPDGGKWRVAVDKPDFGTPQPGRDPFTVVELTDCGMATSGNYRNRQSAGAGSFGHTISPLTGRPVETDVLSATVTAPTAMEADAVATACMAGGSPAAKAMAGKLNVGIFLILADSTTWTSPSFP